MSQSLDVETTMASTKMKKTMHIVVPSISAVNVGLRNAQESPQSVDIFCLLQCGQSNIKSDIITHTTAPSWDLSKKPFRLTCSSLDDLKVQLYASMDGHQELLGEAICSISTLDATPNTLTSIKLPLAHPSHQDAGEVILNVLYELVVPNVLMVTILEAKGLAAKDGKGEHATSDPFVTLHCMGKKYKTRTISKTLSPQWRQRFYFPWKSSSSVTLELVVEDKDVVTNDFLGRVVLDLSQWSNQDHQILWLGLEPETMPSAIPIDRSMDIGYGQICIALSFLSLQQKMETLEQGEEDYETIIPSSIVSLKEDEIEETVIDETKPIQPSIPTNLSPIQWKSGDYQIRVYIHQVQDLIPMDLNGLCDPVVQIECMGQQQYTKVYSKQLSCSMNESFSFYFSSLTIPIIQHASLKITVLDADGSKITFLNRPAVRTETIGFCTIDLSYVYVQTDHHLDHKWIALVGIQPDNSHMIQGYLLLSMVVLGPGDQFKQLISSKEHVPNERMDANQLVLIPPRVIQTLQYLVVTIYEASDLPVMDQTVFQTGIDAYIRITFLPTINGKSTLETKKISCKGSSFLTAEFQQELWFPVMVPTMSTIISISIWDWDLTIDELVGSTIPYDWNQVLKSPQVYNQPHYANVYGPPIGFRSESNAQAEMFADPMTASTYRGRLRLSLRMESRDKSVHSRPHVRTLMNSPSIMTPCSYRLRILIYYGTEIPQFKSKTAWYRNSKMSIQITIGKYTITSMRVPNVQGICHWNEYLQLDTILFPGPLEQVPDIMIYLIRQQLNETRRICYTRISPQSIPYQSTLSSPHWYHLQKDTVLNDLTTHEFTGNVLMNLQFERMNEERDVTQEWKTQTQNLPSPLHYTLLIYVFQGRGLPSADSNGLLDPYVKVTCGGVQGVVKKRLQTCDPCWYETIALDVQLPHCFPHVSIQVFDSDEWDKDDYIGKILYDLTTLTPLSCTEYQSKCTNQTYIVPRPQWYSLQEDTTGELLLSFEIIQKENKDVMIKPPPSIRPMMKDRLVEITCLGCRSLQPNGLMSLHSPRVQIEYGDGTTSILRSTNPSCKPSSENPNYLERMLIPMKIPVDALYAPRLNLRVYDQLLGGFYQPLLGACSIDLATRLLVSNGVPNPFYKETKDYGKSGNPNIASPLDFTCFPGYKPLKQDTGGGVKAALENVWSPSQASSQILKEEVNDEDLPPHLQHRQVLDGSLEDKVLTLPPFESFPLYSGESFIRSKGKRSTIRTVGCFKGMIRILKTSNDTPMVNLNHFYTPQRYWIRVYVLDGFDLFPKPNKHSSDPYLRLRIGKKTIINDRDAYQRATLHPKFYKMYEYPVELPGDSILSIDMMEYDAFPLHGEEMIGTTRIDLEDRWFSSQWHQLGTISISNGIHYKPIEQRDLYTPYTTFSQGSLRLWIDILTPLELPMNPPIPIALPPRQMFEIRIIIYKAKHVIAGDLMTQLNDLFITTWFENHTEYTQSTDVHWRARDGKASFNWRMKFPLELPLEEENGYIHFQLWDKDLLYDDCLADTVMDLNFLLHQAYKTNQVINNFKQKLGIGKDPEDASWLTCTTRDPKTGDRITAGKILVSIEILPIEIAKTRAAGLGRSEPNNFPVLAEPVDRLNLSAMWNPLYVLEALVGPQIYHMVSATLFCLAFTAFLIFAEPFINVLAILPSPYGRIVCIVLATLLLLSWLYCFCRCRCAVRSNSETFEKEDDIAHGGYDELRTSM